MLSCSASCCHTRCHVVILGVILSYSVSCRHARRHAAILCVMLSYSVSYCHTRCHAVMLGAILSYSVSCCHARCHTVILGVMLSYSVSRCYALVRGHAVNNVAMLYILTITRQSVGRRCTLAVISGRGRVQFRAAAAAGVAHPPSFL